MLTENAPYSIDQNYKSKDKKLCHLAYDTNVLGYYIIMRHDT